MLKKGAGFPAPFLLFIQKQLPPFKLASAAMGFRQIFWDNDGVLVDTERYYLQASQEALASVGVL